MMALTLKVLPVGITYAVWSGLGIISISIIAYFAFGQKLDLAAILGMGLIVAGILVINLFSKTAVH
jgi:small multidrug resistance pump